MRTRIVLLLCVFFLPIATFATDLRIEGSKSSFTLPFKLVDNRVFIESKINGKGPFWLILDTGASGMIMRPAAERLGLKIEHESQQSGVGEKTVAAGETHLDELQIGDAHFFDLDVGVLPGDDTPEVFGR